MRVGLKYHSAYPNAQKIALLMKASLDKHGVETICYQLPLKSDIPDVPDENMAEELQGLDLIVSIGGDGTLLSTARLACYADIPVLGINAGRFGFLTEATPDEIDSVTDHIVSGSYRIEERRMIGAAFSSNGKHYEYIGLNDVVIHRQALSRILSLETYLDNNHIATYEGDGLIISTPTGSTAYNLSAGGSIVHPNVDCLLLTPICPHTLGIRPMIVGPSARLNIIPRFDAIPTELNITFDGQRSMNLTEEEPIYAGYSTLRCRLARIKDEDFFSLIRRKLHWGVLVR